MTVNLYLAPSMCQLNHTNREAPSQQYFENHILEMSDSIEDVGVPKADLVLYLAVSYVILFICLAKGITFNQPEPTFFQ